MVTEILAQITGGNFCAGIYLVDDRVTEAAPIVARMKGWTRDRVRQYCSEKGWRTRRDLFYDSWRVISEQSLHKKKARLFRTGNILAFLTPCRWAGSHEQFFGVR